MRALWIAPLRIKLGQTLLTYLLLWPPLAQADVYRYLDTLGMVHYTDNQAYAVKRLPINSQEHRLHRDGVLVRVVKKAEGDYLFVLNRFTHAVTLNLRFSQQRNLVIPSPLLQALLIPANQEQFIGKLSAKTVGDWDYNYHFDYQLEPEVLHAEAQLDARLIRLPESFVQKNTATSYFSEHPNLASPVLGRYRIAQGFNGDFSHNKLSNRYALDIALPVGTPLYATRAGVVMAAVDRYVGGGLAPQYRGKANHLRVRHADGTMTLYAHLQTGSLQVRKGERVKVGQRVAASGNTGYSSGPHLHLALQMINAGRKESIPFTLQGNQPIAGLWLAGTAMGDE